MLTASLAARLNNSIQSALDKIGASNGTALPSGSNNLDSYAYDIFIAEKIEKHGKSRKEAARKAAIKAGVMFDHEQHPKPEGTNETIYHGNTLSISVQVKTAADKLNPTKLKLELLKLKLTQAQIDNVFLAATEKTKAAHVFTTTLNVG